MTVLAGPIEEVTIDGRRFTVSADNDSSRDLGGKKAELLPNADATTRVKMQRTPWSVDGVTIPIDDSQGDQEFLSEVIGRIVPISFRFTNQVTYSGAGTITSEVKMKTGSATAEVSFGGSGTLEQQ
jgi:hypothetical protein